MVRFIYASDMHTEFPRSLVPALPDAGTYDAVILAGDIGKGAAGLVKLIGLIPTDKQIFFLPGNHEFYGFQHGLTSAALAACEELGPGRIHVLNPGSFIVDDVLIVGATLWSPLTDPYIQDQDRYDAWVARCIADFQVIAITEAPYRWTPGHCRRAHYEDRAFIAACLEARGDKRSLVITHFMPTAEATDFKYVGSALNPYFIGPCDDLIEQYQPDHWVFGHTHTAYEKKHSKSKTLLHCNPIGYPGENGPGIWRSFEV